LQRPSDIDPEKGMHVTGSISSARFRPKPRTAVAGVIATALLIAISGCGGEDFTPAAGNAKAGPFEVLGEPVATFDKAHGLKVSFDAVNRSGDQKDTSRFLTEGDYSVGTPWEGVTWGTTGCYGGDPSSTFEDRSDTMAEPGEEVHVECIDQAVAWHGHEQDDYKLDSVTIDYDDA